MKRRQLFGYVFGFFGVWGLDLSVGCLELSVGCLDLSVGCLDLSFGCLELSFGCLDLSFGCLDLSFGFWTCLDLSGLGEKRILSLYVPRLREVSGTKGTC